MIGLLAKTAKDTNKLGNLLTGKIKCYVAAGHLIRVVSKHTVVAVSGIRSYVVKLQNGESGWLWEDEFRMLSPLEQLAICWDEDGDDETRG